MKETYETIAVIGGGVSGLSAAHYLLQQGYKVDLYEAGPRLGGRICIDELGGDEICFGGKNIGYQYTKFREFLENYGSPEYEYFGINSARLVKGRLKVYNSKRKIRSLLTLKTMATVSDLRLLKIAMQSIKSERLNGDLCGTYFKSLALRGPKLSDHFSSKFVSEFLRTLTVRMNGAEPYDMSIENLGTHLQMLLDEYEQLTNPITPILDAFKKVEGLRVFLNEPIQELSRYENGYTLETRQRPVTYTRVLLALPAYAAAKLLKQSCPAISHALANVRYRPVGVIVANYQQAVFRPNIRALTFGPDFPLSNIGAYGIKTLNRVRYTFSGEAAEDVLHESLDDGHLLNMAEAQAAPFFNLKGNFCTGFKFQYWAKGLCAYSENEAQFKNDLKTALRSAPNLYLTGDYQKGASIENCFRASKSVVTHIVQTKTSSRLKPHDLKSNTLIGKVYVKN